mmetsp:Transcript_59228/g.171144  ORF Transcript_59228/g.171144 Transcript_59228/m.171144 type:complete len:419 (-) Transcript_59228:179-1435(-)|eukprot:CAMPEP_0176012716 /NCGR_PEP_ID=MMETSP0120_2-20121206/5938_1 /TAXON_ID=160619 /ORGANISM="Kryptoperidinium foliaceum, Strain CCMP 1326" /LENGTH=418 /DNA_ID=CAMNT_0017345609 /DNA_START=166 /DNA_END=1422 /DNA_ORIENTATION=-
MSKVRIRKVLKRGTFAEFMDGAPSRRDGEKLLHSLSMIARGNLKKDIHKEKVMNDMRYSVGLYNKYILANEMLSGSGKREKAFKAGGHKQMNHRRGTDGWFLSMFVLEVRAFDNYLLPLIVVALNSVLASILSEVGEYEMANEILKQWDEVFSVVLRTALAFLLVFRLNRCAMRFWEARGLWGNLTHITRNLVGGLLMYGSHARADRDQAIRWAASFCVAAMHFIRSEHEFNFEELSGILSHDQVNKLQDADHSPLYAASMIRYHLKRIFKIDQTTPPQLAYSYAVQMNTLEQHVTNLIAQVSGMEKIRSTPLPVAYVTHLRTLLFLYCLVLPYVWVKDWGWVTCATVPFTAFALFGIEGVSSEVEIPFDRRRPNHLALDAYCLVIQNSVQGLVVHDANIDMQGVDADDAAEHQNGMA